MTSRGNRETTRTTPGHQRISWKRMSPVLAANGTVCAAQSLRIAWSESSPTASSARLAHSGIVLQNREEPDDRTMITHS